MEKKPVVSGKALGGIAFAAAILALASGGLWALLLIAGLFLAAVYIIKEEEAAQSCLNAFLLAFFGLVVTGVLDGIRELIVRIINLASRTGGGISVVNFIFYIVGVLVVVMFGLLAFSAFMNVMNGKPSGAAIVNNMSSKLLGIFIPPPVYYQQPMQPMQPPPAPPQAQSWTCSCGRQNSGPFCASCGKPMQ